MRTFIRFVTAVGSALACCVALHANAQSYPAKAIKVIVPWPAGGVVDVAGRIVGEKLQAELGQPVVVENRAGAGGMVGADAVARAARQIDPALVLFGLPGSELVAAGRRAGLRTASEGFADRAYQRDGALVPRGQPGAVIDDPDAVVARALRMVRAGAVQAIDGSVVPLRIDTLCVHGDTPGAAALAARLRKALEDAGIEVSAVGRTLPDSPDA